MIGLKYGSKVTVHKRVNRMSVPIQITVAHDGQHVITGTCNVGKKRVFPKRDIVKIAMGW